jgi:hypothetical protein
VRYGTNDALKGWEELCRNVPGNTWEAWVILSERPTTPDNRSRQHPLKGKYSHREVKGKLLVQWQYEVTSGGRIWCCPDPDTKIVWLTDAGPGHPGRTDH